MLIEKVPDLANLILASTFLGQFLTDRPFSIVRRLWVSWSGLGRPGSDCFRGGRA
jgi:hypothetical protein